MQVCEVKDYIYVQITFVFVDFLPCWQENVLSNTNVLFSMYLLIDYLLDEPPLFTEI